MGVNDSWRGLS
uniref:Uncharacterized protein n=1 Tax=Anguilla anguilla TaxID=7936 RepID=A0A0E9XYU5_ANGAN